MAVSTCVKCNGHSFELTLFTPIGETRQLTLVQCSNCGAPVGALNPPSGPEVLALRQEIAAIDEKLGRIARALQEL
jgi:hypothetical protein